MGSSKTTIGVTDDSATETDSDSVSVSVSVTSANSSRTQTDKIFHNDTANHSSSPLDSPPHAQGEKVLTHHNIRVYEAKVLQIEYKQIVWRFYVHYLVKVGIQGAKEFGEYEECSIIDTREQLLKHVLSSLEVL